jgi:hypothetical protein
VLFVNPNDKERHEFIQNFVESGTGKSRYEKRPRAQSAALKSFRKPIIPFEDEVQH